MIFFALPLPVNCDLRAFALLCQPSSLNGGSNLDCNLERYILSTDQLGRKGLGCVTLAHQLGGRPPFPMTYLPEL